jgi:hypothetical protein
VVLWKRKNIRRFQKYALTAWAISSIILLVLSLVLPNEENEYSWVMISFAIVAISGFLVGCYLVVKVMMGKTK